MKLTNLLFLFSLLFIFSCQKPAENHKGTVAFNANIKESLKSVRSIDSTATVKSILLDIQTEDNQVVVSNQKLELTKFGEEYISVPMDLTVGNYKLTKFLVLNENDEVVYAAPVEGSEKAYLVNQPLPISFVVEKDQVSKVSPEVINAVGQTPADFGYSTFTFNVVETYDFLIAAFVYNDSLTHFELTDGNLSVTSNGSSLYNGTLEARTNQITVPAGYSEYTLLVSKAGYNSYLETFSEDSLKQCFSSPITIVLNKKALTDGLIAYYPFNGNVNDESGNENHGEVFGLEQYTIDRFGNLNSAFNFDGISSGIMCPDNDILKVHNISITTWIKIDQLTTDGRMVITSHRNNSDIYSGASLAIRYGEPQFILSTSGQQWEIILTNNESLVDGNWHFLVGTFNNGIAKLYVDNVLKQTDTLEVKENIYYDNSRRKIGYEMAGSTHPALPFMGAIDELRIYDRELSISEINSLWQSIEK